MEVVVLTVGDEVLAGDITNSNATWLAGRLTESGAAVSRILTVPDDRDLVAETIREWAARFDAVIVTGGLGGTHDDVTAGALADAFGRDLVVDEAVREDVIETVAAYREANPETVAAHDVEIDVDAWAALPEGSRALPNPEGLCPGCVIENVYAFPGVPAEMKALFERVAAEFGGETVAKTLYTPRPEGAMLDALSGVRERFDVAVGSYPAAEGRNRIKLTGTDPDVLADAVEWLRGRIEVSEE
ncbi:competence/damage-inducible protein A [Halalkalicoccus sp. NIPERK01]|uniref:competence/damage-inducible protein A n=1 Tax=Halalkalicoccus sp. NIPERK01 TaxID=3053469 RepID=UPI00256F2026|nr:competence/damage-inducible protein A [Halalkalicoccus sp. NIPERK01]MDL5360511.1 competence/damage-inducible protein A [Halalkalicoccus sp. NIPERK01]